MTNNGFISRWSDRPRAGGVPQLPASGAASAPPPQEQPKRSLTLRLHFLGKHFPLPVQTTNYNYITQKNTPTYPFTRYFKYLLLIITMNLILILFASYIKSRIKDVRDFSHQSNRSWAVPELSSQTPNSVLRSSGKPRWGLAFSQFSESTHRLKPWQFFTLHKQNKKEKLSNGGHLIPVTPSPCKQLYWMNSFPLPPTPTLQNTHFTPHCLAPGCSAAGKDPGSTAEMPSLRRPWAGMGELTCCPS